MKRLLQILLIAVVTHGVSIAHAADATDNAFKSSMRAMHWRNIGPFNGGRGTSVVGHPTNPEVFWFGHSSGGLWKTEDAGTYWMPVGDGQFRYASVGAIALYEKNPDIMYVGLGATLVQIISEKTKPLSKLVTLHNILEHTEGPPNQGVREVYAKVSAEMDEYRSDFESKLKKEMAKFDELAGR
jgi:hypothetical protein